MAVERGFPLAAREIGVRNEEKCEPARQRLRVLANDSFPPCQFHEFENPSTDVDGFRHRAHYSLSTL